MAGGGVGEAMAIGALMGAGTGGIMSAAQDKDPLQGALLGAVSGAAMGGAGASIGGAMTPAADVAKEAAVSSISDSAIQNTLAQQAGQSATSALTSSAPSAAGQIGGETINTALSGQTGASSLFGQGGSSIPGIGAQAPSYASLGSSAAPAGGAAAPSQSVGQMMAAGKGTGFAPGLTNAQAYGAGAAGGISGLYSANQLAPTQEWPTGNEDEYSGSLSYFKYDPRNYRADQPTPNVYTARYAQGGIASLGSTNPMNNPVYPQSQQTQTAFSTSPQYPNSMRSAIASDYDARTDPTMGTEMPMGYAGGGGIASLGGYSDGGRLTRGPGDGVSDSIPASIGGRQPARLADGEFVVPARIVSELGNGSTDAGARRLYDMMDRVQSSRSKTMGKGKVAKNTRAYQALPA